MKGGSKKGDVGGGEQSLPSGEITDSFEFEAEPREEGKKKGVRRINDMGKKLPSTSS